MIITNNILSANVARNLGIVKDNKSKSMEKLSSGYRVNKAADDAAGLSISEKMRSQVRGLMRAAENTKDGISLVHTTDGATDQAGNILQRMRELTIQSLNIAVNTGDDRAKIQLEFDQLQSELDRVNDQTEFNKKPCFTHYADDYYVTNGNKYWVQDQKHTITDENNSMTIKYTKTPEETDEDGNVITPAETDEVTITVPKGTYTTQQLIDEIDDATKALGKEPEAFAVEYTGDGFCNLVLEDGYEINEMAGGLTYLFHDEYIGSDVGSLIGTTYFDSAYPLLITAGKNDTIEFSIQYYDGTADRDNVKLTLPPGQYTRQQAIDKLNELLNGTNLTAMEYGEGSIMIGSDVAIVSGLRGNMFEIDDPTAGPVYTSVFYDNTKYGNTLTYEATFKGGNILRRDQFLKNGSYVYDTLTIDDTNNKLRVKVNGADDYTTLTLSNGSYTLTGLAAMLNNTFSNAGLDVEVTTKPNTDITLTRLSNNTNASMSGLMLKTVNEKGLDAKIEFDIPGSTAYETLFTRQTYTDVGLGSVVSKPTTNPYQITPTHTTGAKELSFPLTLTTGSNRLRLQVYERPLGSTSTNSQRTFLGDITLTAKQYNSMDELLDEINARINDNSTLRGKIEASADGNKLRIGATSDNRTVTSVTSPIYSSLSADNVYDATKRALLVASTTSFPQNDYTTYSASGNPPTLTINTAAIPETITIDSNNNTYKLRFTDNSVLSGDDPYTYKSVVIPDGTYSREDFLDKLKEGLKKTDSDVTEYKHKTFSSTGRDSYYTTNYTISVSASGTETKKSGWSDISVNGDGQSTQGTTATDELKPATCTMGVALPGSMTIDDSNDQFAIKINNTRYEISLDHGSGVTAESIRSQIQTKINQQVAANSRAGSDDIIVELDNGKLKFTTLQKGAYNNISLSRATTSDAGSEFTYNISTDYTEASATISKSLQNSIAITSGVNDKLKIRLNGVTREITIPGGTYTPDTLANALTGHLSTYGVHASVSGNTLKLISDEKGSKATKIAFYSSDNDGSTSALDAMFGSLKTQQNAYATLSSPPVQNSINIEAGKNKFSIQLDGSATPVTVDLTPGTYNRSQFASMLKEKLGADNVSNVTVSNSGALTIYAASGHSSIHLSSTLGDQNTSAYDAIFGTSTIVHPGVADAAVNSNGMLQLKGTGEGETYTMALMPQEGSDIAKPVASTTYTDATNGYDPSKSVGWYKIESKNVLTNPSRVTSENNVLSFSYNAIDSPSSGNISITMPTGDYTPANLISKLQEQLDSAFGGQRRLDVSIDNYGGIAISSMSGGGIYNMDFNGSFYETFIQGNGKKEASVQTSYTPGYQKVGETYIVGRKDVRNQTTEIIPNTNDGFSLELWIDNTCKTLSFTLDPGSYNADSLVNMLNSKLAQAAHDQGLPDNIVKAAVGKYNTGVTGAEDGNALDFYLNPDVKLQPASYRIEGLKGTSLFDIFYKTTGKLIPAYTTGTKDLSGGVTIPEGEDTFTIDIDGNTYEYTIPEGTYTQDEFIDLMNDLLDAPDNNGRTAPAVTVSLSGNSIRFAHDLIGKHSITNVLGSAMRHFFYESSQSYGEDKNEWLQVGANSGQGITFKKYSVSSHALGVNSINVTEKKYADKALERIDTALSNLMANRSRFGALENRLEYTYNIDTNTAENIQDSESKLRDTDMADEMTRLAKEQILEQAGISVLAQARQQPQMVLQLLQ